MDTGGLGFLIPGSRRKFIVVNVDESIKEHTGVLLNSLVFAMWTITHWCFAKFPCFPEF
jgi:hypothetical protein